MALKPEYSVMTGLSVAGVVFAIHSQATPSQADIQALPAGNTDIDQAERKATIMSAGVVSAIALIAKDPTVFVMGATMVIGMAAWTRHSNFKDSVHSMLGPVTQAGSPNSAPETDVSESATTPYSMFSSGTDFLGS
jgi:hypothetical protein